MAWVDGACEANGIRVHDLRTGGDRPPVVLLHGLIQAAGEVARSGASRLGMNAKAAGRRRRVSLTMQACPGGQAAFSAEVAFPSWEGFYPALTRGPSALPRP